MFADWVSTVLFFLTPLQIALLAIFVVGIATPLGALPIYFVRTISQRLQDGMLGFSAGVMLAATSFSLILPGVEVGEELGWSGAMAALVVAFGILIGAGFVRISDRFLPHEHFRKGVEGGDENRLREIKRIWLFVFAITIHNFPEGLAVGVGFAGGELSNGLALALGMTIQNIPEGLAVALALLTLGYSKSKALGIALLTGVVEWVGGLIGLGTIIFAGGALPFALAFAAGAMLYVISHEIIPETHRKGYESEATFGLMIGFVLMFFLDVALG